jgi:hypothetical protein
MMSGPSTNFYAPGGAPAQSLSVLYTGRIWVQLGTMPDQRTFFYRGGDRDYRRALKHASVV